MARSGSAAALAILAAAWLGGCGTMANLSEEFGPAEKKVFGGVRLDASYGTGYAAYPNHSEGFVYSVYAASTACAMAADIPLSAIGDTLTLPWTLTAPAKKVSSQSKESAREKTASPADEPAEE
jgi:uncharacterized protein YceK